MNEEINWNYKQCYNYGEQMANALLKKKKQIKLQKLQLEESKSLLEYYQVLLFQLTQFFEGMIWTFFTKLYYQAIEKQKKKGRKFLFQKFRNRKNTKNDYF